MSESLSETLLIDGEEVSIDRSEYQPLIEKTATDTNCSLEEAWAAVKDHLFDALSEKQRRGRRKVVVTPQPAIPARQIGAVPTEQSSAAVKPANTTTAVVTTGRSHPAVEIAEDGRVMLRLNGSPVSAVRPEDLPLQLRSSSQSVMEMLAQGLIALEGEHPDAAILRAAMPTGPFESGLADPKRNAAIEIIRQKQYRFPFQKETVRLLPTDFNKTSLFHVASNNSPRRFCRDEMLGKVGDSIRIEYRGEELRHDDELVFMQLLHVARGKYPFEWVRFRNVPFIKGSRGTSRILSSKDVASVGESLLRLRNGLLVVTNMNSSQFFTLNLVKDLSGSNIDREVMIDPAVVLLCASFAAMDTEQLFATSGVARQLFKYISTIPTSIEQLHPIKITNLFELCYGTISSLEKHYRERNPGRSDAAVRIAISKKISDFRRSNLPAALKTLESADFIKRATIDDATDKVVIVRNPSAAANEIEGPSGDA